MRTPAHMHPRTCTHARPCTCTHARTRACSRAQKAALAAVKMKNATGTTGGGGGGGRGEAEGNTDSSGGVERTGRDEKPPALSPLQGNRGLAEMNASLDQVSHRLRPCHIHSLHGRKKLVRKWSWNGALPLPPSLSLSLSSFDNTSCNQTNL